MVEDRDQKSETRERILGDYRLGRLTNNRIVVRSSTVNGYSLTD